MNKNLFKSILITLFLSSSLLLLWYHYQLNKDYEVPATELFIESGQGVKQISAALTATGYIHNDFIFRIYVWQKKLENKFYAGQYRLPEILSMRQLVNILTGNNSLAPSRRITVLEGWHTSDIAKHLSVIAGISENDFYLLAGYPYNHPDNQAGKSSFAFDISPYPALADKPAAYGLEGYLFPDTYDISLTASVEEIIMKLLNNFEKRLTDQLRAEIKNQGRTIYEVVTIASILERELKTYEEKKLGAGLINNRLAIGMPLQMDSTVNFITGKNLPQVLLSDLEVDSAYNTYKYKGLPPGPISNPGIDSIMAVVYPIENDYFYFLTDKKGVAHFSKTYEEHLAKKRNYLD